MNNKSRKKAHIVNVVNFDADGHVTMPASLTLGSAPSGSDNSGKVPTTAWVRSLLGNTTDFLTASSASEVYLSQTSASNTYLSISGAAGTYLTQNSAAATYLSINNAAGIYLTQNSAAATYLSISNAAGIYLTQNSAASIYLSKNDAAGTYLTQNSAASTYLSISNAAGIYLTQNSAAATYASLSGSYSNPSWITSLAWSKITGAPSFLTGITSSQVTTALGYTPYNSSNPSGYITSSALSGYLNTSNYTSTLDSVYLKGTTNPSNVGNFTLSIGNNGTYSYVQSHSSQPLYLNPLGNSVFIGSGNTVIHSGNYGSYSPSLTGSGASGTWGINVTGTAGSISGYNNPTTSATANTIVYRDSGGDIYGRYIFAVHFNASCANNENPSIAAIWTNSASDNYLRKSTPAHLISQLGLITTSNYSSYALPLSGGTMTGQIIGPSINTGTYGGLIQVREHAYVSNSQSDWGYAPAITFHWGNRAAVKVGLRSDGLMAVDGNPFVIQNGGTWNINVTGSAGSVAWSGVSSKPTTLSGYGITDGLYQAVSGTLNVNDFHSTGLYRGSTGSWSNRPTAIHNGGALFHIDTHPGGYYSQLFFDTGGNRMYMRSADAFTWGSWVTFLNSNNFTSWAPSLTGSGASGTWGINITGSASSATNATNSTYATYVNHYASRTDSSWYNVIWGAGSNSHMYSADSVQIQSSTGALRANIFYDNQDTAYYLDPNSYSRIYRTSTHLAPSPSVGSSNWVSDFQNTPTSSFSFGGDLSSGGPSGTWWFQMNMRHSNSSSYWGTQVAWGWEDNANRLLQRNVTGNSFSGWVEYLNSNNYTNWAASRRSEGSNYIDYARYVYNNGAYSGSGWVEPSDLGVRYAANAGTVGGIGVSTLRGGVASNSTSFYVYGDANTYYPVVISLGGQYGMNRYSITRGYSDPAPWDPIGTGGHRGGLTLTFDCSSDIAWGGNDKSWRIIQFHESYTTMVAGMALPVTDGIIVWLRGGGSGGAYYSLQGPSGINHSATVYYSGYTGLNGAFFGVRSNTSNVSSEILSKYPIRGYGDGDIYVNNQAVIHSGNIGSQSVAYASNSGSLNGWGYTSYAYRSNGSGYYQVNDWIQFNTAAGLYWPSYYGFHITPNTSSSHTQMRIIGSKNSYGGIYDEYSAVNGFMYDSGGNGGVYREANGRWYWYHSVGNNCMGIGSSSTSGSYALYVSGAIYATSDICAYSDVRKKENIVTIDNALEKVTKLRGVFYNKIGESTKTLGVIAQEVEEVLPEAVTYAADVDEYGVKYANMVGLLIEAMKEQQSTIEDLKRQIEYLVENK